MKIQNNHSSFGNPKYFNGDNVEVYKDTLLKATQYPLGQTKKYHFLKRNMGVLEKRKGEVLVENIDSVGAVVKYDKTPTCVLNMASFKTPGGGVAYGSKAQEEALFRCSNLGLSVSSDHYPLLSTAYLYSTDIVFFKDKNYADLPDGHLCDVISCAAIKIVDGVKEENYEEIMNEKIYSILTTPAFYVDTLILGAWGCGVYKNDPVFIANTFKQHLVTLRHYYDKVIFAIINDENSVANNYQIFKSILEDGTLKD